MDMTPGQTGQKNKFPFLTRLLFSGFQSHCESPGESQMQRGDVAQRRATGGDRARVLQLRLSQCLPPGLHPGQGRLRGGAALQVRAAPPTLHMLRQRGEERWVG